ncbi:MAG TPA: DUF4845 domain-containing protein [Steroidobacteraceae bacterium]|nr:DUF4845 domain-containing protein [Steroidobacteraceae bacterium]
MYKRQRGVTFIGWLCLLIPLAIVGYAGIRVAPVYLNYMRVAHTLDQTVTQFKSEENVTYEQIRIAITRHFEIEEVEFPEVKSIDIHRAGRAWVIEAKYEDTAPLFANLAILVAFDKMVQIG